MSSDTKYAVTCPFCMKLHTAETEELALSQWAFHAFTAHPDIANKAMKVANSSHEKKKTIRERAARWIFRL